MYERLAARLLGALHSTFGDAPDWELRPNKTFGLYLYYDGTQAQMGDVRRLIDYTVGFGVGVILAPRTQETPSDPTAPSGKVPTP